MKHTGKFWFGGWALAVWFVAASLLAGFPTAAQAAEKPIKIGFSMALTGGLAAGGKAALLAMQIWAEDVNKKGGLLGRPVELVFYDDQTKPANVPTIYTKLLDVDKVDFVVSPYGTNMTAPAMPIVMERKLTFISLFALAINEKFNYPYYFGSMPTGPKPYDDWSTGFFEVAAAQNPKPRTVALVGADAEYPVNALTGARKNIQKHGFRIVYDKRYPPATTDYTPIARAIKAVNPDIVYVASYPPDTVGMIKASKEVNLKPKIFGGGMVGLQFTPIQQNLGVALNGIVNYHTWVPEPTLMFPGIGDFFKKYKPRAVAEKLDPLGYYLPPLAYAYLEVLAQAIEATKSLDQKMVGEYIRKTEFSTIAGKIKFATNGEWAKSRMLMTQFQNIKSGDLEEFSKPGKMVVLSPEEFKSGKLIYPFQGWK